MRGSSRSLNILKQKTHLQATTIIVVWRRCGCDFDAEISYKRQDLLTYLTSRPSLKYEFAKAGDRLAVLADSCEFYREPARPVQTMRDTMIDHHATRLRIADDCSVGDCVSVLSSSHGDRRAYGL